MAAWVQERQGRTEAGGGHSMAANVMGRMEMGCGHSMTARLYFGSEGGAGMVLEASRPDFRKGFSRSKSGVERRGNALEISIDAQDLTALRASFNSVMKGIVVSGNVLKAFEGKNRKQEVF